MKKLSSLNSLQCYSKQINADISRQFNSQINCYQFLIFRLIVIMSQNKELQFAPIITSQTNPIFIDDESSTQNGKYINSITSISRLPAFDKNDHLTNLLYSKFLVKGVKPINYQVILNKLKANGQKNTTERNVTKETTSQVKEIKITRNDSKQGISSHHRNSSEQREIFDFSIQKSLSRKEVSLTNLTRKRPQSGFERSSKIKSLNRPQSAFPQSASLKMFTRPLSATIHSRNLSTSRKHENIRPQSSFERTSGKKSYQYEYIPQKRSKILTISESNPNIKTIDYIQKNKREASFHKKSVYLTAAEVEKNSQNRILVQESEEQKLDKFEKKINSQRQIVTKKQRALISQKQKDYLLYMKDNMPVQYQECLDFIASQNNLSKQETISLFSCELGKGEPLTMTEKEVEQFQVRHFYQDFLNKCINLEYNIKKTKNIQKSSKNQLNILNCHQVEDLKSIYQAIQKNKEQNLNSDQLNNEVKEIVKDLHFFKELRKEVLKSVFDMDYQIVERSANQVVLENNQQIEFVYVILNGSVTKKNYSESEDTLIHDRLEPPEFLTTLFDGQIFGLPAKTKDQYLHYSITALQHTLLMLFPYSSYRKALSNNQNIEDRIEILKHVLPNTGGRFNLTKQDYESIAFQMETRCFSSQEIIVRQGERHSSLMIIASGQVDICFESIIERKKQKVDHLAKKREGPIKKISIAELKKTNMVNYQVLFENERKIHYYFSRPSVTIIRGDAINWKGFAAGLQSEEKREAIEQCFQYSLMSMQNNTKLYLLSPLKMQSLSEHLQQAIKNISDKKGPTEKIQRNQQNLNKWEEYKIKICSDILKFKDRKLY